MALFNSILNIFFEEDDSKGVSTSSGAQIHPPGATVQSAKTVSSTSLPTAAPSTLLDDKVYKEFAESLKRALENNNLPGFDFFEFRQLYHKFKNSGKTEAVALETALASAETMRIDKNMIIAHYQHYEKVMNDQRIIFDQEFAVFHRDNIDKPAGEQKRIEAEILEKENAIRQFTTDIEKLKARKIELAAEAVKAQEQSRQVELSFHKAFNDVSIDLQDLVKRLKTM